MDELIAFVEARLDEDEAAAKTWRHPEWERRGHAVWMRLGNDRRLAAECPLPMGPEPSPAEHIARHDPARVLRRVEGARRMLSRLCAALATDPIEGGLRSARVMALYAAVCAYAYEYDDYPGYRQEWKP
jgi:hypothetical protein